MNYFTTTAPCGIDCFNCEVYHTNVTPAMQERLAVQTGRKPEKISCRGCRESGCIILQEECRTKTCAAEKEVDFCHQCGEFPCSFYQPCARGAEIYPHNLKVYNLCRIKSVGLDEWASKEASLIRKKYYLGTLRIGSGVHLDKEPL